MSHERSGTAGTTMNENRFAMNMSPPTPHGRPLTIPEGNSFVMSPRSRGSLIDDESEEFDSARFNILPPKLGGRTQSTAVRLRRQGLHSVKSSGANFAVRSIRQGSDAWRELIKPFVSDLAFRSLVCRRYQSEVSFRTYTCHAAVLFIDLSSYSQITAAISHRGAHTISNVVNAYLDRLLTIIRDNGGDVVKFAGDAVLVVWEGEEKDLGINVLCAAKCAVSLQKTAGTHPVEGTSHIFRIHCGLCCGLLESEIFAAPTHVNMQRLYHSVGGETLAEISELVDLAKAGEVCVSQDCVDFLGCRGKYKDVEGFADTKILTDLELDRSMLDLIERHVFDSMSDRLIRRNKDIEEDFIHPRVLSLLSHGGLSPTQIAQIRNLCVLFIAMTSNGSSVNWLMEVQGVLDKNRCPVVQIIDDDKGVHIVAAINLYESVPETSVLGLEVCTDLVDKQVGCAIGVAMGSTFCGVTGCNSVACRWDITGPPAVRAARLMQYALEHQIEVAVDESLYEDPIAATRLNLRYTGIGLKGSLLPVNVYSLSGSKLDAAFRVLETVHGSVHNDAVEEILDIIGGERSRCAVVVTGIPQAGKKIVCQRAAGYADLVPFMHLCDESSGLVQLARTIATWFQWADNDDVRYLAASVIEHMDKHRWSRAHDECIQLVNTALEEGLRACFLVDRIQFLDEFSLSLIRECLHGRPRILRNGSRRLSTQSDRSLRSDYSSGNAPGKICFLCVHVSLYKWKSAAHLVEDITRSHRSFLIPIIEVKEASREELRTMFRELSDMEVEDRWLRTYAESSGYCAGYFIEKTRAVRNLSGKLWSEGKRGLAETTEELVLHIPPGFVRKNRQLTVMQISADVGMRFAQLYDELPPLFQTLVNVLTIATQSGIYKLPRMIMWEVLNDLIAEGVGADVLSILLKEMTEMFLLKVELEDDEEVLSFQSPGLADIAMDVCTPDQVESIAQALIDRLEPIQSRNGVHFKVPLILAELHHRLGQKEEEKKLLWLQGYKAFLTESKDWAEFECNWWKELIEDEITGAGYDAPDILGDDFCCPIKTARVVGHRLPLLKIYSAPVSLGPMGHTLSLLCRNTFHEFGVFHGASEEAIKKLMDSTKSASQRYMKEMAVVEEFLAEHGYPASAEHLQNERDMIEFIAAPAVDDAGVQMKAVKILDDFVPQFVETRLERLYSLIAKLREDGIPAVVENAQEAIKRAYKALQIPACRTDAAQNALMIMASMNWKPKPLPEYLPMLHYQTVARIRNKVLKRLSDEEVIVYRHQQTIDDLEVFLVVTPLLYAAQQCHVNVKT